MSIDARVETVIINEDGSGKLKLVDRPKRRPGDREGCAGVNALSFKTAPEEVTALNGMDIWGGSGAVFLGDDRIGDRLGYTKIEFVPCERFVAAVEKYHAILRQRAEAVTL